MIPNWLLVTLRCWIAFIAFTNFGAAFRCFTEEKFLHSKFFTSISNDTHETVDSLILERVYGHWSFLNGIVLVNTFFFLHEKKIIGMAMCVLTIYLSFFALEGFLFHTITVHGPTMYPCVLSGWTLIWLCIGYKYLCSSSSGLPEDLDENEVLRKQFPYRGAKKKL